MLFTGSRHIEIKQQKVTILSHFTHIPEPEKILIILILHMRKHRLRKIK